MIAATDGLSPCQTLHHSETTRGPRAMCFVVPLMRTTLPAYQMDIHDWKVRIPTGWVTDSETLSGPEYFKGGTLSIRGQAVKQSQATNTRY